MYVIEMGSGRRNNSYGKIHRAGCADVTDPELVTGSSVYDALCSVWPEYEDGMGAMSNIELVSYRAPCARALPLR